MFAFLITCAHFVDSLRMKLAKGAGMATPLGISYYIFKLIHYRIRYRDLDVFEDQSSRRLSNTAVKDCC